ncbi:MAG: rhomboid family intramembrane serine protease [Deltaproteobacteria bacterium]|nr:MAG: rhomboid family intramembrane serine protease [Deltaproteobacteria bacterium]
MSPRGRPAMSFGMPPFPTGIKWLVIVTLAASVMSKVVPGMGATAVLTPALFWHGWVWQVFTYPFVIPDARALLWSLLGIWLLGGSLEQQWGMRRFVGFYIAVSVLAGLATALVGLAHPDVGNFHYFGNWPAIAGLIAAFAVTMPNAQIFFSFVLPVSARALLAISVGMTVLFMIMDGWVGYVPELLGFPAGALWVSSRSPRHLLLRARVWWIDRRLRRSRLRVVRGKDDEATPLSGGRGSDKYLH